MEFNCEDIQFNETIFDLGYIPLYEDVISTGLVSVTANDNLPEGVPVTLTFASDCVQFPDESGTYNQSTYTKAIMKGETIYIPFMVNSGVCGATECDISYTWTSEKLSCSATAKIKWYVATCDFQDCFLKSTELLCNADTDCDTDFCKNDCLQNMIRLVAIDQTLEYKIKQKDWGTVNMLYDKAFTLCRCGCGGKAILSPIGGK